MCLGWAGPVGSTGRWNTGFGRLGTGDDQSPLGEVGHRPLRARRLAEGVVWFDFSELCGSPRSQNDYLELADRCHTVLLSDVPQMGPAQHSEARRFTWLVDFFYDLRRKFAISSAVLSPIPL